MSSAVCGFALSSPGTWEVVLDRVQHMALPALTLGIVGFGEYALITRSAIVETLGDDIACVVGGSPLCRDG